MVLAKALSKIETYDRSAKAECIVHPLSKELLGVLELLRQAGYIGSIEIISQARGGFAKVRLLGKIHKCGVTPRFPVSLGEYEKFEKRFLPGFGIGLLIVSTTAGLMSQSQAKARGLGGRLIAYCY